MPTLGTGVGAAGLGVGGRVDGSFVGTRVGFLDGLSVGDRLGDGVGIREWPHLAGRARLFKTY